MPSVRYRSVRLQISLTETPMTYRFRILLLLVIASGVSSQCRAADAGLDALLRRLPDTTNAIVYVDMQGLKNSPIGQREQWAKKQRENFLAGMPALPPMASLFVMGCQVDAGTMRHESTVGLAQMDVDVSISQ